MHYFSKTLLSSIKKKNSIKLSYFKKINERYTELTSKSDSDFIVNFTDNKIEELNLSDKIESFDEKKIMEIANRESATYLKELGELNMVFPA